MFWSSCILASEFCASALQNVLPHNSADTERRSPAPYTPRERFNVIEASASAQIILESETVSHGAHVTATRRRWARSRAKDWHSKRDGDKRVLAFRYFPHERNHFTRRLTREKEEGRPFSPPPLSAHLRNADTKLLLLLPVPYIPREQMKAAKAAAWVVEGERPTQT